MSQKIEEIQSPQHPDSCSRTRFTPFLPAVTTTRNSSKVCSRDSRKGNGGFSVTSARNWRKVCSRDSEKGENGGFGVTNAKNQRKVCSRDSREGAVVTGERGDGGLFGRGAGVIPCKSVPWSKGRGGNASSTPTSSLRRARSSSGRGSRRRQGAGRGFRRRERRRCGHCSP